MFPLQMMLGPSMFLALQNNDENEYVMQMQKLCHSVRISISISCLHFIRATSLMLASLFWMNLDSFTIKIFYWFFLFLFFISQKIFFFIPRVFGICVTNKQSPKFIVCISLIFRKTNLYLHKQYEYIAPRWNGTIFSHLILSIFFSIQVLSESIFPIEFRNDSQSQWRRSVCHFETPMVLDSMSDFHPMCLGLNFSVTGIWWISECADRDRIEWNETELWLRWANQRFTISLTVFDCNCNCQYHYHCYCCRCCIECTRIRSHIVMWTVHFSHLQYAISIPIRNSDRNAFFTISRCAIFPIIIKTNKSCIENSSNCSFSTTSKVQAIVKPYSMTIWLYGISIGGGKKTTHRKINTSDDSLLSEIHSVTKSSHSL